MPVSVPKKATTSSDVDHFRVGASNPETSGRLERLKTAVRAAGGNRVVVERSGIPASRLTAYLSGEEMKLSRAVALAQACEITLDWLVTGAQSTRISRSDEGIAFADADGHKFYAGAKNFAVIPKYPLKEPKGTGDTVKDEEDVVGHLALDQMFVRQVLRRHQKDLVTIPATGDSMEPTVHDGDLLIVDISVQHIENSRIYVLDINGALLVKRLSLRLEGSVVVRSDNPKYEAETVSLSDRDTLRIIGQVVYQAGPVRS